MLILRINFCCVLDWRFCLQWAMFRLQRGKKLLLKDNKFSLEGKFLIKSFLYANQVISMC